MTGYRITRQTGQTIAANNRLLSAFARSRQNPPGSTEWPDLQPVRATEAIAASDGTIPSDGNGMLLFWNPAAGELQDVGPIKLYSLSRAPLTDDSIHLAIQDALGNHWVISPGSLTHAVTFQLTAPLASAGSSAAAVVVSDASGTLTAGTAIVVNSLIAYDAASGDYGVALLFGSDYVAIELKQGGGSSTASTILIQGLVDSRSGSAYGALASDTATAKIKSDSLTSITSGYTFTAFSSCTNPFKLNAAENDVCIISKFPDGDYFLLAVIPQHAPVFFTATSDPTDDGGTNKFTVTIDSYNGPGVAPTEVWDLYNIAFHLRTDGTGYAEWNQAVGKWIITSCVKKTLWIRGKVYVAFDDQPGTFEIDNITGVDGKPPEGPLTVQNTFKAESGDEDAEVIAMWNQAANDGEGEWEGRVACPAVTSPTPPE